MDERARAAALNNAVWCDAVWRSHGLTAIHEARFWATADRAPVFYPDAVTLEPTATARELLAQIDDSPGCSIKDSFAVLDLHGSGYNVLFDAEWYLREPGPSGPTTGAWTIVETPADLAEWARAHGGGDVFRPGLLGDPTIRILVRSLPNGGIAGAIASRGGGVVGVSNVFGGETADVGLDGLVDAIQALFPGETIVGYGAGEDLSGAIAAGFLPIGPLRVWMRS